MGIVTIFFRAFLYEATVRAHNQGERRNAYPFIVWMQQHWRMPHWNEPETTP